MPVRDLANDRRKPAGEAVDLVARPLLRDRDADTRRQLAIPRPQRQPGVITIVEEAPQKVRRQAGDAQRELLEERPPERERNPLDLRQLFGGVVCLVQAQLRRLLQSLRAERREIRGGTQGEQALVGADVTRRLLATDVLLARLQRQHPAAFAVAVGRLPDQSPRHLAQKLLVAAAR